MMGEEGKSQNGNGNFEGGKFESVTAIFFLYHLWWAECYLFATSWNAVNEQGAVCCIFRLYSHDSRSFG